MEMMVVGDVGAIHCVICVVVGVVGRQMVMVGMSKKCN